MVMSKIDGMESRRKKEGLDFFLSGIFKRQGFFFFSMKKTMTHILYTSYNSAVRATVLIFIKTLHEQQCKDY